MILDTSILVDIMNSDHQALAPVDKIEADNIEQVVPASTLQELYIGDDASELSEGERQ